MATIFCDTALTTGGDDGTSWEDGYRLIQDAIDSAGAGDEVWVKARTISLSARVDFDNANANAVYGGFATSLTGTSGSVAARNVPTDITVLDAGNSVQCGYVSNRAYTIDGFKFYDGNTATGGGVYAYTTAGTITFANCIWDSCTGNTGAAVYSSGGGLLDFDDCTFSNNVVSTGGSGATMYISTTDAVLDNCVFNGNAAATGHSCITMTGSNTSTITSTKFYGNTANSYNGAAMGSNTGSTMNIVLCEMYSNSGSTIGGAVRGGGGSHILKNCLIYSNTSTYGGGAYLSGGTNSFDNCTIADNTAGTGSFLRNTGGATTTVTNCIIWGGSSNPIANAATLTVTYSDVHGTGVYTGTGNVNDDPNFVGSGDDPYDLASASEAVDSGNAGAANYSATDFLGRSRVDDPDTTNTGAGTPAYSDMGAYEMQVQVATFVGSLLLLNN